MQAVNNRANIFSFFFAATLAACSSGNGDAAPARDGGTGTPPASGDAGGTSSAPADAGDAGGLPANYDAGVPIVTAAIPLSPCAPPAGSDAGVTGRVYTANVTLGGTQTFPMLVDTGSSEMAVASSSCSDCAGVAPLYTPGATATDTKQPGSIAYASGSINGEVFDESAQIGDEPAATITLLAIGQQNGFFKTSVCSSPGIFGLSEPIPPDGGEIDYLDALVSHDHVPGVFSIGLCPGGGSLWIGGYDPSATTGAPQFTPMSYGLLVSLTGVAVGDTVLPVPEASLGLVAIDTGTSAIDTNVDALIIDAVAQDASFQKLFGDSTWFDAPACKAVAMSAAELDAALPTLTFMFGSAPAISVRAGATSSYLEAQPAADGSTLWCPAIVPTSGTSSLGMGSSGSGSSGSAGDDAGIPSFAGEIGVPFLRSSVVIFDRQNQRLGFAPHRCAE